MGFLSSPDDSAQREAEQQRKEQLAQQQRNLRQAEQRQQKYMRARLAGAGAGILSNQKNQGTLG